MRKIMSRSLTKWKDLKQKFSPASLHFLCSCLQILTSTLLLASSSLLNVNAFLPVVLLKCAFLPPALALSQVSFPKETLLFIM